LFWLYKKTAFIAVFLRRIYFVLLKINKLLLAFQTFSVYLAISSADPVVGGERLSVIYLWLFLW